MRTDGMSCSRETVKGAAVRYIFLDCEEYSGHAHGLLNSKVNAITYLSSLRPFG